MTRLVIVIASLSLFGLGGGNAVWPQLYTDSVDVYHWVTPDQFAKLFALARLGPAPGTMLTALIGLMVGGFGGAALAATAWFLPSGLMSLGIASLYDRFHEHPWRAWLARAMIPIVLGLTWVGAALLSRGAIDGWLTALLAAAAAAAILFTRYNASLVILAAAAIGLIGLR